jgi:hypothetical protein
VTHDAAARPLRLSTADAGFEAAFQARLHWSADTDAAIEQARGRHPGRRALRGDAAVLEYTAASTACRRRHAGSWNSRRLN